MWLIDSFISWLKKKLFKREGKGRGPGRLPTEQVAGSWDHDLSWSQMLNLQPPRHPLIDLVVVNRLNFMLHSKTLWKYYHENFKTSCALWQENIPDSYDTIFRFSKRNSLMKFLSVQYRLLPHNFKTVEILTRFFLSVQRLRKRQIGYKSE